MPGLAARVSDDISPPVDEVTELARAIEQYKRERGRAFPTWSEVLEVVRGLGYAKREAPG